jgi:hypothetical protein
MSTLRESLDEYLAMRRALGFQLDKLEYLAGGFVDWLATRGQTDSFTISDAVARPTGHRCPSWANHRRWADSLPDGRRSIARRDEPVR